MLSVYPRRITLGGSLLAMLLCAAGAFPAAALAADIPEALRDRVRGDFDLQALNSADFILSLQLTRAQARAILPIYEEACRLHVSDYDDQAEIQPEEIRAYTAFLEQDRLNQGFSPEVERWTAQIHHRAVVAREELAVDLNALADRVREGLTPYQQDLAENYKPNKKALFAALATANERRRAARRARHGSLPYRTEDPPLAEAREEKNEISRATHPRPDTISRYLLAPAAAEALHELADLETSPVVREAVDCWREGTKAYPRDCYEEDREAIRTLGREINHWNLVNGMHFSCEQLEKLAYLAEEAERLKTTRRKGRPKDRLHPDAFNEELVRLEFAAEAVLRPGQLEVLNTYQPCLLPPKNLKDPVRVGQATDSTRMSQWLSRARGKHEWQVERMIDRLLEVETAHLNPLDEKALAERRDLLGETVSQATAMDDVEFAVNKDDLAEAIQPRDRKGELNTEIDTMRRHRHLPGRTSQFLLNGNIVAVYKTRHEQLSAGAAPGKGN